MRSLPSTSQWGYTGHSSLDTLYSSDHSSRVRLAFGETVLKRLEGPKRRKWLAKRRGWSGSGSDFGDAVPTLHFDVIGRCFGALGSEMLWLLNNFGTS